MFEDINVYMTKSLNERKFHLNLNDDCIEIGTTSTSCRALFAHYLKTTMPTGNSIHLCHACNNSRCSNPNHLYWGTPSENLKDSYNNGRKSPWEQLVEEHGLSSAKKIQSERTSGIKKPGNGGHNKLDEETINKYKEIILNSSPSEYGWIKRVSKHINLSHTQIRRFAKRYFEEDIFYTRKSL